jgi:hypothetical protein
VTVISATARPLVVRRRSWSVRLRPRSVLVCAALAAATFVVGIWSIMVGDFPLSVGQVLRAVFGDGGDDAEFIVQTLRLPRAVTAVLVGAALGMSGAVFQSIARNPLGSPDIIGFESGAAAGAVLTITVFSGSSLAVAGGAVAGGLVTAVLVYVLAYQRGLAASRLVLVGIGIGFTASAVVDYLITRAQIQDVQRAAVWLTGSLNGRTWDHVRTVGLALLVLAPLIVARPACARPPGTRRRHRTGARRPRRAHQALRAAARRRARGPGRRRRRPDRVHRLRVGADRTADDLVARRVRGAGGVRRRVPDTRRRPGSAPRAGPHRTPGRHRHGGHRRPLPAVAAVAPRPDRCAVRRSAALLFAVGLLASCASGSGADVPSTTRAPFAPSSESATAAATRHHHHRRRIAPERIIPLDGDVAEIVFALGLGDRVVATDLSATYPPEADALPQIGYQRALNAEPILEFDPTLVIGTDIAGPPEAIEELERVGVPVVIVPTPSDATGPGTKIRAIAAALGVPDAGERLATSVESAIAAATPSDPSNSPAAGLRVAMLYLRGSSTQLLFGEAPRSTG